MFISAPASSAAVERLYQESEKSEGFVMNLTRAWAWRPEVFQAFAQVRSKLMQDTSLSKRELAVLVCATAAQLGDSYCALAWGRTLTREADAAAAAAVIDAGDAPSLTPRDRALAAWARQVVRDPNGTKREDIEALHAAGLDDREIFDATAFVAFRLAFSTVNDALGVAPDAELAKQVPQEVRQAVAFGREPA
jgi:uncharacterized peroxidase-related enzyme